MGYKSCMADPDPDLWMREEVDLDGNILRLYPLLRGRCVSDPHDAMAQLDKINKYFKLKPESMGDPKMYLGAKLKEHETASGVWCWTMSPSKYVREAVKNCDTHLEKNFDGQHSLPKSAPNPFPYGYEAELIRLRHLNLRGRHTTGASLVLCNGW